jgi:N-acetylglucosaminyldiphosphoundecaprenol N-acetyl-beta-D-mannosaminyltransferase
MASIVIDPRPDYPQYTVLGVRVDAVQISQVISQLELWLRERSAPHYVVLGGMYGVMQARRLPEVKHVFEAADLVVPDGMPLVWAARRFGHRLHRRVYGPELIETFCRMSGKRWRHFFYGGAPGVPERVAAILHQRYSIQVAGSYSPPFRPLKPEEDSRITAMISESGADVVWVGLGSPLQDRWMYDHCHSVGAPVMLGVGAAFNFITGTVKQAPRWMQESGLECLYRLIQEPRRLWRRYLVDGAKFLWDLSLECLGLKQF